MHFNSKIDITRFYTIGHITKWSLMKLVLLDKSVDKNWSNMNLDYWDC